MRFVKTILAAAAFAFGAFAAAPAALAQPTGSATAIVLNYERIVGTSDVGRDLTTKLQAIGTTMQGELQPEQTALEQEEARIRQSTQGMTPEQVQANSSLTNQINQFGQRFETFRARQVTAGRDLEYTRQRALADFNQQITPFVREVMEARGAGIVLDASAVQLVLPAYDGTDDVVQRLNQRLRTINVTRQAAPPQQPQAGQGQQR